VGDGCLAETWHLGTRARTLQLPPNSIFLTPAETPVRHTNFGPPEGIELEIFPELLEALGPSGRPLELPRLLGVHDPLLHQLMIALRDELYVDGAGDRLYAEALGTTIARHLAHKYASSGGRAEPGPRGLPPFKLKLVREYIHAHIGVDFGIGDLAGLVQLNVDSFIRAFRQSVGLPPHRYVVMERVEQARALLRDRTLSIPEIATRTGFGTASSFTRAFRRVTGQSPRDYRISQPAQMTS
jgi:AraC family transcriptional regulator